VDFFTTAYRRHSRDREIEVSTLLHALRFEKLLGKDAVSHGMRWQRKNLACEALRVLNGTF
jgi:hypothetical protein